MNIEQLAREAGNLPGNAHNDEPAYSSNQVAAIIAAVRAAALEEAAKVCDGKERRKWEIMFHGGSLEGIGPLDCAAAIRALAAQSIGQAEG